VPGQTGLRRPAGSGLMHSMRGRFIPRMVCSSNSTMAPSGTAACRQCLHRRAHDYGAADARPEDHAQRAPLGIPRRGLYLGTTSVDWGASCNCDVPDTACQQTWCNHDACRFCIDERRLSEFISSSLHAGFVSDDERTLGT